MFGYLLHLRGIIFGCILMAAVPALCGKPAFNGTASATAIYSDRENFYGDTEDNLDLVLAEGIFNVVDQANNGWAYGAQIYLYQIDEYEEFTLDYAYARYEVRPWMEVSLGRNKLAFGLHNDAQDFDAGRTFAFLPIGFYPLYLRPVMAKSDGLALSGSLGIDGKGFVDYRVSAGYLDSIEDGAPLIETVSEPSLDWDHWRFHNMGYSGQIGWRSLDASFRAALSYYAPPDGVIKGEFDSPPAVGAPAMTRDLDIEFAAISFEYLYGDWTFNAEIKSLDFRTEILIPALEPFGAAVQSDSNPIRTAYVSASLQLDDRSSLGMYYEFYDDDYNDGENRPRHRESAHDIALAYAREIRPGLLFKVEYHEMRGLALAITSPRGSTLMEPTKGNWSFWAVKSTVLF